MPLCMFSCLAPAAAQATIPVVTIGPNVHVSTGTPTSDHEEVEINADPENANNLVACSHVGVGTPGWIRTENDVSTDGGRTWHLAIAVGGKKPSGDPACAFGLHDELYVLSLWKDGVDIFRSADLGKTWSGPATASDIDREYFTIDRTGGRFNGRIYINGTGFIPSYDPGGPALSQATMFRSGDGGKTFSAPVYATSGQSHWILGMGNGIVLADGTFGFVFGEWMTPNGGSPTSIANNAWLKFITTSDGGQHFNKASIITERRTCDKGPIWGGGLIPYIAVDQTHGPFRNRIYVAYDDRSSGRCVMIVRHSSDAGATWSGPVTVDRNIETERDPQGPESSIPAIAVNKYGIVGVSWYNRADDPRNFRRMMRFAASNDGGESFTAPVAVSTFANDTSWKDRFMPAQGFAISGHDGIQASVGQYYADIDSGDTGGLAAGADGIFHALWSDDRTHVGQLWTAAISVSGRAWHNGDPSLADLADVSATVHMYMTGVHFDAATRRLSMDITLQNHGKKPLYGPIKVRILRLSSKFSNDVSVETTDNGQTREDIVWNMTPRGGATFAPHGKTETKHVVFVLHDLKPISLKSLEDTLSPGGLLNFDARILAREKR